MIQSASHDSNSIPSSPKSRFMSQSINSQSSSRYDCSISRELRDERLRYTFTIWGTLSGTNHSKCKSSLSEKWYIPPHIQKKDWIWCCLESNREILFSMENNPNIRLIEKKGMTLERVFRRLFQDTIPPIHSHREFLNIHPNTFLNSLHRRVR